MLAGPHSVKWGCRPATGYRPLEGLPVRAPIGVHDGNAAQGYDRIGPLLARWDGCAASLNLTVARGALLGKSGRRSDDCARNHAGCHTQRVQGFDAKAPLGGLRQWGEVVALVGYTLELGPEAPHDRRARARLGPQEVARLENPEDVRDGDVAAGAE